MEKWTSIEGYEGLYSININSDILSMVRTDGKLLTKSKERYIRVGLTKNGKQKLHPVHRLLGIAFIPNPENKPEINHKDGNKWNNSIENLEWVTKSENMKHAFDTGLKKISALHIKKFIERTKSKPPWNKGIRQKPATHGTMYEYNIGCRCDKCRKENTRYCRAKKYKIEL